MAIAPEQAASWSYPQPEFSDDAIVHTMSTGLLGRLYLSGHLDGMEAGQLALVAEGVQAFKEHRGFVATGLPFWPLGLPGWEDGWVAHGIRDATRALLTVWRRDSDLDVVRLSLPWPVGSSVDVVYPRSTDASVVAIAGAQVDVQVPRRQQAVTLAVYRAPDKRQHGR
jgi:alpha-galactosidase